MSDWATFAAIMKDWASPLVAAVIGAIAGGIATWRFARAESARLRRERYGQALLDALGSARIAVQSARTRAHRADRRDPDGLLPQTTDGAEEPLTLPREARDIWVNAQLAATLEKATASKLAISGWALHHHESLLGGAARVEDFDWLDNQLQLGEYLVVAWLAGDAPGIDFKLDRATLHAKYAPKYTQRDLPQYGSPIASDSL
ncbi:hypothetical protein [Microbacterium sp. SLBN-111]|uniref:hypothetical protein n=1 Tax=Microbacterium sp. SLBN-111 TaxID=3377733 RepID=UPI003C70F89B